MLEPKF